MHNWSATAFYYNESANLIGHDAAQVNDWLAAHPDYRGFIWMSYGDGGDDVDVSSIFFGEDEDAATGTFTSVERAA